PIAGIGVAVLDAGVQLDPALNPALFVPGSASYVGQNPFVDLAEQGTHGTAVAQIILTLTPQSKILSLQTSTGSTSVSGSAVEAALMAAAANPNIRVINHSNAGLAGVSGAAMLATAVADQVVVMQAGNDWAPYPVGDARHAPGLSGKGIIVGGLGPEDEMLGFGNQAGDMAQHYVVATGSSQFADYWGTSFATPRVSALAAGLRFRWPDLRAEEIVAVIKRTATDMGAPGVDAKYGWGKINPTRAYSPIGLVYTPSAAGTTASPAEPAEEEAPSEDDVASTEVSLHRLTVGAPLFNALKGSGFFESVLVFDQFNRDFNWNLSASLKEQGAANSARSFYSDWQRGKTPALIGQSSAHQIFSFTLPQFNKDQTTDPVLLVSSLNEQGLQSHLGFGVLPKAESDPFLVMSLKGFLNPSSSLNNKIRLGDYDADGVHSLIAFEATPGLGFDLRYSDIDDTSDNNYQGSQITAASHVKFGDFGATIEGGWLSEGKSLFGGTASGPFAVDHAETRFLRFSGYRLLSAQTALVGSVTGGYTEVNPETASSLSNFSDLVSSAWMLGLSAREIFKIGDSVSLTIAQPLSINSGSADVDIAYGIDSNNRVLRHQDRINFASSGIEGLVEVGYRMPWTDQFDVGAYLSLQTQIVGSSPRELDPQFLFVGRSSF
ncbi:MAG: S8 family serine peptidase, partial [Proteobacteria bacterium]|nr:S8 family serine peptidase [Pseudomonadota bacterium]